MLVSFESEYECGVELTQLLTPNSTEGEPCHNLSRISFLR